MTGSQVTPGYLQDNLVWHVRGSGERCQAAFCYNGISADRKASFKTAGVNAKLKTVYV